MPHQCVRCNEFYDDGDKAILEGCTCGGKLFFYLKKSKYELLKQTKIAPLSVEDKKQMETDILELVGVDPDQDQPVVLDFESIRIAKPGTYELDLVHLFKNEPVVFKLEEGKYMIDLAQTFESTKKSK